MLIFFCECLESRDRSFYFVHRMKKKTKTEKIGFKLFSPIKKMQKSECILLEVNHLLLFDNIFFLTDFLFEVFHLFSSFIYGRLRC